MMNRTCKICGKTFKIHPHQMRSEKPSGIYCSNACRYASMIGKAPTNRYDLPIDEIIELYKNDVPLVEIAKRLGVSRYVIYLRLKEANIPKRKPITPRVYPGTYQNHFKSLPRGKTHYKYRHDLPMATIAQEYRAGSSTAALGRKYNISASVISRRLKEMGVSIRRPGFGIWHQCSDGHAVQSHWEQAIDEWLTEHNIEHEVHPVCPWSKGSGRQYSDFLVGDTYIEVWGINGNATYDKRRLKKIRQYKEYGAKLIQIFPHHILDEDYSPLEILL